MDVTYVQNIPEYMQTDLKQSLVGSRFFGIFPWSISISNRGFQISKSQIDPTTLPMESEYIPISKRNATYVFFGSNEKRRALFGHLINRHWPTFSLKKCLHQMAVLNVDQELCELGDGEQLGVIPGWSEGSQIFANCRNPNIWYPGEYRIVLESVWIK